MVRLVKGAYWDSEIKRAQVDGLDDYPVYTRKAYTDVAYLACARRLLAAPDAVYPQFATHNAHTLAAIHELAGGVDCPRDQYEFQCLHGMGEPLYEQVVGSVAEGKLGRPCRIYAPVGTHETLLAYLVRRLLENGANTSFVNRIGDPAVPLDALVEDPVATVERLAAEEGGVVGRRIRRSCLPRAIYGAARRNSRGVDLADEDALAKLAEGLRASAAERWSAEPLLAVDPPPRAAAPLPVRNPADRDEVVGHVREATAEEVERALAAAVAAARRVGRATPAATRAAALERAADALEAALPRLARARRARSRQDRSQRGRRSARGGRLPALLRRPGAARPRPIAAVAAARAGRLHQPVELSACDLHRSGRGRARRRQRGARQAGRADAAGRRRGGAAALARRRAARRGAAAARPRRDGRRRAGRRPARAGRPVHRIDRGRAAVAADASRDACNVDGRAVPLIAETGGQNAMIVDSSALAEQVVADVVASAFDSAGQRCSALRVLCVQEDVADRMHRDARRARWPRARDRRARDARRRRRPGDRRRGARGARAPRRGDARARPRVSSGARAAPRRRRRTAPSSCRR